VARPCSASGTSSCAGHPHVFAAGSVDSVDHVLRQWDAIKAEEKGPGAEAPRRSTAWPKVLHRWRIPRAEKKAARSGSNGQVPQPVWEKIDEELRELRRPLRWHAGRGGGRNWETCCFSVNACAAAEGQSILALHGTNGSSSEGSAKWSGGCSGRFRPCAGRAGRMDELWNQIKAGEELEIAERPPFRAGATWPAAAPAPVLHTPSASSVRRIEGPVRAAAGSSAPRPGTSKSRPSTAT